MLDLNGQKVLVLGLGDTGMSMTRWLARHGARVTVADTRSAPPHADALARELPEAQLERGEFRDETLRAADMIAISPGVDSRMPAVAAAIARGTPVAGDIELFARALPPLPSRPRVIAITGTNGKTTVTSMAGDICAAAGLKTVVAGNIGTPVLDALPDASAVAALPDAYVLEVSSFQLETTASLDADAATMLNLTEDHLDRYDGIAGYEQAKARIFIGGGMQVLNREDPASAGMALPGRGVMRFGLDVPRGRTEWGLVSRGDGPWLARGDDALLPLAELRVAGLHNAANALAAGALCHAAGVGDAPIAAALQAFKGLPHRVEKIAVIDGVSYYEDSKGTNVGATVAALDGFREQVVLIAGGLGKGQNFAPLAGPVAKRARAVILIGRDREQIATALAGCGVPLERAGDLGEALQSARRLARAGDAVLLSPACASFDMFRDYVHRGRMFAGLVREMAGEHG
jgi:UDP-N-acetylmuramoylalanine--D-glutamate ligase